MDKERYIYAMNPLIEMYMKELKVKVDWGLINQIVREEIQKLI